MKPIDTPSSHEISGGIAATVAIVIAAADALLEFIDGFKEARTRWCQV